MQAITMDASDLSPFAFNDLRAKVPFPEISRDEESTPPFLRRTAENDFGDCVQAGWDLHNNNEQLKNSITRESDCQGQGTRSARCVYTYQKEDLAAHKEVCASLDGEQLSFGKFVIICNARHSKRENGAYLTDTTTYINVPECFPKDVCESSHFDGVCENFEDEVAASWAEAYRNSDYYSVSCRATSQECATTYSSGLGAGAIAGIAVGGAVFLCFVAAVILYFKKHSAERDAAEDAVEGEAEDDKPDNETETDTTASRAIAGIPKAGFGLFKGWRRDRHLKHTIFWAANVIWLTLWIVFTAQGCEPARYGSGCDVDSPNWFWIEMQWLVGFIWLFLYVPFLAEFYFSSTRKYLANINNTESLVQYMDRLYRTAPTLNIRIECYHMETRTVTYTDSNGRTQTRTETYPVVTYTESEVVNIVSWEDRSVRLQNSDIEEYQVTKVTVTKTFVADAAYEAQRNSLVARNRHRDVFHNLIVNYEVPGYKDKMLTYVDLDKKPVFLSSAWCWLAHLTLVFAFPYRLWMSSTTGKIDTNVHKSLNTQWSGQS